MKRRSTLFTFSLFLLFATSAHAQEYCEYNAQSSIDFGHQRVDEVFDILVQPDGKTLILGTTRTVGISEDKIALLRLDENGDPDTSLGAISRLTLNWQYSNSGYRLAQQPDGKIIIGGISINGIHTIS